MSTGSAPAKIILFGEHAVVHGALAIAAPVSALRATAALTPLSDGRGIRFISPHMGGDLPGAVEQAVVDDAFALTVDLTLRAIGAPPFDAEIRITSTIPIASGMGSGAAVATAIARALCAHHGVILPPETLNPLIYEVEKLHHGTPSGIDNTVIVYEQPVGFVRGTVPVPLHCAAPIDLIIADTGMPSSTRPAVADVWTLLERDPETTRAHFAAIDRIAHAARDHIAAGAPDQLGPLMSENHALLRALTVSSPELDRLADAALSAGASGAKLSGGGRGGILIALAPPDARRAVIAALASAGAVRVMTTRIAATEAAP